MGQNDFANILTQPSLLARSNLTWNDSVSQDISRKGSYFCSYTANILTVTQPPTPSPIKIAHLGLRTNNPTPLVSFYKPLLNAHIVLQNNYISVLTWAKDHRRLAIFHSPLPSTPAFSSSSSIPTASSNNTPPPTGLDHIALKFASLNDLARMYHAGKAGGIEPHLYLDHGVTTSMYYKDPDGN
ncbi:hypothetical protein BDP81DRAFT_472577 [Colletotrichum phormii]|uniref:VOC domain-containing protein n=1 Tax=Colletotrichum phormii TaxID=359342 RepID=A0AAI9ZPP6_9PEZI|nr:uncharacterized protein BDP81DRAFT_472577 [Colletotrichum phormii]KAK1635907.1 hypothetical protein BDP81DRAFT_472577 [Colletotrichum phormii]